MKLSKTQEKVLEKVKQDIDYAREHDFLHWVSKAQGFDLDIDWDKHPNKHLTNELILNQAHELVENDTDGYWKSTYEKRKSGIALVRCNTRTLKKLEEFGLIEIIHDSTGEPVGVDVVKVLNY